MAQAIPNTPALIQGNRDGAAHNAYRYTFRSVPVIDHTLNIHKHQYKFDKKLGQGGFGEVYSAHRVSDRKQVAIKIVSLATFNTRDAEGLKDAFLNEVAMSKRLAKTSRHIIEMYDFDFHSNGLTFIVMELGQQDLETALRARPLSAPERKLAWRQLVSIAVALHDNQIVHLDIKPQNMVVFPGNIIKLVDLGIAQKVTQPRVGRTGTIPYSAPEVTQASYFHMTNNSSKADVWSWGAVLYRITYHMPPDFNYKPPCDRPPEKQQYSRDPNLRHLLRHVLVIAPAQRPDTKWLAQHPYTKSA